MRKISANLILPVSSDPLRNAVIIVDKDGRILDLIDTGGNLREESSLEFYPGTITPGFILPWFSLEEYLSANTYPDKSLIDKLDRDLFMKGIKGVGLVLPERMVSNGFFEQMSKSSIYYHPVIELRAGRNEDAFEVFNRGIDLVSMAWNEFNLSCSLTARSPAMEHSDIGKLLEEYTSSHRNILPPEGENPYHFPEKSLSTFPNPDFEKQIEKITLHAASLIFEEDDMGSIEKGKRPGLNLIIGHKPNDAGAVSDVSVKVLV